MSDEGERSTEPVAAEEPCSAAAVRAAGRALAVARELGVPVEGCDPRVARAERSSRELGGDTCRVFVREVDARFEVRIEPAPASGAPDHFEAWIGEDGVELGRTWVGGSTWALAGELRVLGETGHAMHEHGGSAARVGTAAFRVLVTGTQPITLRATRVHWLTSPTCAPDFSERATLTPAGLALEGATEPTLELPPGEHRVLVGFPPQEAYYTHCDRFAARVEFAGAGHTFSATAETSVTRFEPMREL